MRGRYGNRVSPRFAGRSAKPSRVWSDVSAQWVLTTVGVTTSVILVQLQAPASLAALTSDPPEDLTVLRLRGSFSLTLGGASFWTLALLVQDTAWTLSNLFTTDADKRILWARTFQASEATNWLQGGILQGATAGNFAGVPLETTEVDIAPKVRIEAGKALFLVAYDDSGLSTLTTASANMRLLFQRSGRR